MTIIVNKFNNLIDLTQNENMKKIWTVLFILIAAASACSAPAAINPASEALAGEPTSASETVTLTVFAAASLADAFDEIGQNFERDHPGLQVKFNYGGSQTLRTQIEQGASADVFASANQNEMDTLIRSNFVMTGSSQLFLSNMLVAVTPAANPAGVSALADLAKPGLKLILAAKEVPAGNYSLQVLEKLETSLGGGYKEKVLANVVSYENDVKQVLSKIQLGEADAGIVYLSDTVAVPMLKKIEIPVKDNVIAHYPLAVLDHSKQPILARAFVAFVLSGSGQAVLTKWGFLPVK